MPSVAGPMISSLIMAVVLLLLWRTYRERYLGLWGVASLIWVLRYVYAMVAGEFTQLPGILVLPFLLVTRAVFLLWGTYELQGRRMWVGWWWLAGADLALLAWEVAVGDIVLLGERGLTHFLFFAAATITAGTQLILRRKTLGPATLIVGPALVLIGAINATFPWTGDSPRWLAPLFSLNHLLTLATGFGVLLLFFQRALQERDALQLRLEGALAKALSGYLPICAHCKSIRNGDGAWERIDQYLASRTDAAFSHGICPSCERKHYHEDLQETPRPVTGS